MGKYEVFLKKEDRMEWPVKLAASVVGLQRQSPHDQEEIGASDEDSAVWVVNFSLHVRADGQVIHPRTSPYIWLGDFHKVRSENIAPYNMASKADEEQDVYVLKPLIKAVRTAYVNNFPSALLTLGAQVLNVHYERILQLERGVPIALLYGDVGCGKSRIIETALSLLGTADSFHSVKSCSDGQFVKICSRTTLGLAYYDEADAPRLSGKVMKLFEGKPIVYEGAMTKPRTSFLAAVNRECFDVLVKQTR